MTANCPNCGGNISVTAKFCRHCGHLLQPAPPPAFQPAPLSPARRRRSWITIGAIVLVVILAVTCCILAALSARKALQSRVSDPVSQSPTVESGPVNTAQPVVVDMVVPTAIVQGQPTIIVPVLPPTASLSLPAGTYQIVVAGDSGDHPDGEISYASPRPPDCSGGCGSFKGPLELWGIRIVDQGFVLDLQIRITEISGDPWLFQSDLGRIVLEINGQTFMPKASSFPAQVTSPGLMSGYLSFYDEIPLSADDQYHVVLTIENRLAQPIEGLLAKSP